MTWVLIIGSVIVVGLLVTGFVISATSERRQVEERLKGYLEEEKTEDEKKAEKAFLTEWVSRQVEKSSLGDRFARELARADMKFKAAEFGALIIILVIGGALIGGLIGRGHPLSFMLGAVIGGMLPFFQLRRQQKFRLQKFNEQLADMLNLMVNGLRAGYSTMQAMEAVAKELPPPISDEFRRLVQEMQIGVPMERGLENLLRRIPSDDLDFVVTAINVQREVGGNLSEILDTISYTIRERVRIKGEVRVLTAQVRTSGQIISMLPIALTVCLWFLNPEYMMTFFEQSVLCGGLALGSAGLLIGIGYFIMTRIAAIEV